MPLAQTLGGGRVCRSAIVPAGTVVGAVRIHRTCRLEWGSRLSARQRTGRVLRPAGNFRSADPELFRQWGSQSVERYAVEIVTIGDRGRCSCVPHPDSEFVEAFLRSGVGIDALVL